jgi:hypothetical protein
VNEYPGEEKGNGKEVNGNRLRDPRKSRVNGCVENLIGPGEIRDLREALNRGTGELAGRKGELASARPGEMRNTGKIRKAVRSDPWKPNRVSGYSWRVMPG